MTRIDKACYERGCACYDDRVDDDAVEVILAQPEQEPVAIKRMKEWIEYLKRKSDFGQHMKIPSEMSAGTCWELANELEQFINTTPPQRKPLTNGEIYTAYITATNQTLRATDERLAFAFARAIEAAHDIKENT